MQNDSAPRGTSTLGFIGRHVNGVRRWFVLGGVAALAAVVASFMLPQVIRFAVDAVLQNDTATLPAWAAQLLARLQSRYDAAGLLLLCAGAAVGLALVGGVCTYLSRAGVAQGSERFCDRLRRTLYRHIQYQPFSWLVGSQTGDLIQRCTADVNVVHEFLAKQFLEVVRTVLLMGTAIVLMLGMNWKLSLVALVFMPLVLGYSLLFYRLVGSRFLHVDEAEGDLTVLVQENLTGVRVVRAFGREAFECERFDKNINYYTGLWLRLGRILSVFWAVGDFVTSAQIAAVVIAGAAMAAKGSITLGEFLVFVSYNQMLAWPVRSMGRTLSEMSKTGVSAGRLQEILDAPCEPEQSGALRPSLDCDIRFEHVNFSYSGQQVLRDLSFTIPRGSTFGIIGPTGSGKSTITYLLNRLYDLPRDGGRIWFGDVEIRQIDRQYLRRHVGLVLQDPFLFSKTIEENIAVATPRAKRAEVRRAADIAAVDTAIQEFGDGYETVVGERGVTLSGGQKQRIAIARTLMMDAPVMIFDDSLSAVDLETDAQIRDALRKEAGERTVLLISHRINTLMHADCILVLEDGREADLGTHAALIGRPGLYRRIYDLQAEAAEAGTKETGQENL